MNVGKRYFLDTNVLVYCFMEGDREKRGIARKLVKRALGSRDGIISYQVVQEFFNVAFRRFAQPMTAAEAEQYLITVFRPLLAVHSSPALYMEGLGISRRCQLSWYDSLIVAAALEGRCQTLYSEDLKHGQEIEGLRIENPFV